MLEATFPTFSFDSILHEWRGAEFIFHSRLSPAYARALCFKHCQVRLLLFSIFTYLANVTLRTRVTRARVGGAAKCACKTRREVREKQVTVDEIDRKKFYFDNCRYSTWFTVHVGLWQRTSLTRALFSFLCFPPPSIFALRFLLANNIIRLLNNISALLCIPSKKCV